MLKSFELAKETCLWGRLLILTRESYLCIILREKNRKRGERYEPRKRGKKKNNVDVKSKYGSEGNSTKAIDTTVIGSAEV